MSCSENDLAQEDSVQYRTVTPVFAISKHCTKDPSLRFYYKSFVLQKMFYKGALWEAEGCCACKRHSAFHFGSKQTLGIESELRILESYKFAS